MAASIQNTTVKIAQKARAASIALLSVKQTSVNRALKKMAELLNKNRAALRKKNEKDLAGGRANGLSAAMLDRLTLSDKAIDGMIEGLLTVAKLPCPLGETYDEQIRPNGLHIHKVRVPIGVVGIIYESRPNVTIDAAAICLKSQNAVILRGGSEAFHSNMALAELFSQALAAEKLPADAVQIIPTTDRTAVDTLLAQSDYIDLVIPRGGESLIKAVVEKARMPVIKHYKGVCHLFVSRHADMAKAIMIAVNAKTQRPGVCNALETLILDTKLSAADKKEILAALIDKGVTLFGDTHIRSLDKRVKRATEDDWYAEYLDLRLAVKSVDTIDEAISHINTYGSRHTDAIITQSKKEAEQFKVMVDSASVMVNASTRFADGSEYGMGCEIGISTDKLHARGPMGIADLTTYKWIVEGSGQIRG